MHTVQAEIPMVAADCHLVRVTRYLRFLGCTRDALDDTVQETMLAGLRGWPDGQAPLPWLLVTARNQLRKSLRQRGRGRELVDVDRLDRMWQRHVPDAGDARSDALRECLRQLPARSRAVLQMRYGEGSNRDGIAARVGLGREGVKSLLARLRESLARCVERRLDHE